MKGKHGKRKSRANRQRQEYTAPKDLVVHADRGTAMFPCRPDVHTGSAETREFLSGKNKRLQSDQRKNAGITDTVGKKRKAG